MVGVTGRGSKNSKAVREFKAQGNKAMQSGAFHKAVRTYTKALELDAGNAILYSNRSAAHFNLREFAESLQDAESAILCDGSLWKAYKRKGLALIHMQRYEEAISALEHGLTLVGKNVEMEKNLEFARACQEQAQNLYILPEPHMMQRLESVPVFIVTDLVGQPFFVTYDDGQQVCTFYFDKQDAVATLDWIKSENPGLGDTARVIHITLNQAFNLAQETQKQYYEETTRAAAEEDRRLAQEAEAKQKAGKDGDKADAEATDPKSDEEAAAAEAAPEVTQKSEEVKEVVDESAKKDAESNGDSEEKKEGEDAKESEDKDGENKEQDDAIIDENAPLSFQFRPELRQVQIAVELLNKTPNPRVRPILRDPPSVRKAKAEAAAAAAKEAEEKLNAETEKEEAAKAEGEAQATTEEAKEDGSEEAKEDGEKADKAESDDASKQEEGDDKDNAEDSTDKLDGDVKLGDEDLDDVELTVDNFNGIPIFQAKGMTLLQKSRQLIPLFFSKWDLEAAWEQLKGSNMVNVPDEIEIEVGTLEDVLRRMSENKTEELDSVFFVPSREAMKAINVKFPLDDLTGPPHGVNRPAVRKAGFSKAKQIAARGGSKDEIRAAIREDLEKYAERKKMAEVISQIEHARRTGGVGGPSGVGLGGGGAAGARGGKKAGALAA